MPSQSPSIPPHQPTNLRSELTDRELSRTPSPSPPRSPEPFVEVNLPHHPGPEAGSSDSHLYLLKLPSFLSLEPILFEPHTFTLPTLPADSSVSPYTAATTTIRTRRDPTTKDTLQSNSRIIRWSDGTLSLQVASTPNFYDLPAKALCPDPEHEDAYDPAQDSHTYLLDPHESASTLRVVARATKSLQCVSASASLVADQSIQRLNNEFAAALSARTGRSNQLEITAMKDPEAERKEAERIAKEKERAAKKIEAQQRRQRERDPLGMESAARRAYQKVTGTRSKRDSPPITSGRRMGREDEYDLEDEFIEGSEDEEEEAEESEEERRPRRESERDRKRRRVVEDDDDSE